MKTELKILEFMNSLKEIFREPKRLSLTTICKLHNVPPEYTKWIVEDFMQKYGGHRGVCSYSWKDGLIPTLEQATQYVKIYNESHAKATKKTRESYGRRIQNIESDIKAIKSLLQKIASQNNLTGPGGQQ